MPDDTPFWPHPIDFWSNDWTASKYEPIDPPLTGDITPSRGRRWFSGAGKDTAPEPSFAGCKPSAEPRIFINGFDSRCYTEDGCNLVPGAFNPNQFSQDQFDTWHLACGEFDFDAFSNAFWV